jgi:hypothetical protein
MLDFDVAYDKSVTQGVTVEPRGPIRIRELSYPARATGEV